MDTQTMNGTSHTSDVDTLKADVAALRDDLRTLIADAGQMAGKAADAGKQKGKDAAASLSSAGKNGLASAEGTVKDHPIASLGVAFALGALIGFSKRG